MTEPNFLKNVNTDSPVMLVTGSAKRIGAEIIKQAHSQGYNVIVHYNHSEQAANSLINELNGLRDFSATGIQGPLNMVNDVQQLDAFVQSVLACFGRLDVLVHNASRFYPTPVGQVDNKQWDELFLTNAKAPLMLSQAFLPYLSKQTGSIISILDIHANTQPFVNYTVYSMAKAAHQMMVKSLALDLAPNIRVNGVAPGANVFPELMSDQAIESDTQQQIEKSVPLQRIGTPKDIAQAVMFLTQSSYITGQIIAVDGGRSLTIKGG